MQSYRMSADMNDSNLVSDRLSVVNRNIIEMLEIGDYEMLQRNGQRILSIKQWEGPAPSKDCEVFVGKIPRDCFEDELLPLMKSVGDVYEIRLMMDFSGLNRGFGFVKYVEPRLVDVATKELNNFEVRPGQRIGVVRAVNNCRLHIGGLPESLSTSDVKEVVTALTEGVSGIETSLNPNPRRPGYGLYAVIEYEDHRQAAIARKALIPPNIQMWGKWVTVQWASCLENKEDFQNQVNDVPTTSSLNGNKKSPGKVHNYKTIGSNQVGNLTMAAPQPVQNVCDPFNKLRCATKPLYSVNHNALKHDQVATNVIHLLASNQGPLVPKTAVLNSVLSAFDRDRLNRATTQNLNALDLTPMSCLPRNVTQRELYSASSAPMRLSQEELARSQIDHYKTYKTHLQQAGLHHSEKPYMPYSKMGESAYSINQYQLANRQAALRHILSESGLSQLPFESLQPVNNSVRNQNEQILYYTALDRGQSHSLLDLRKLDMNTQYETNPLRWSSLCSDPNKIPFGYESINKTTPEKHFKQSPLLRQISPPKNTEQMDFHSGLSGLSPARSNNSSSSQESYESGYLSDPKNEKKITISDWNNTSVLHTTGFSGVTSSLIDRSIANPTILQPNHVDANLNIPKTFNRAPGGPVTYTNMFSPLNSEIRDNM